MGSKQNKKQSDGGKARAAALTPERRSEIARAGALAKASASRPKATHRGSFKEHFEIDVECYVLDDQQKTAVISKRGMSATLGMGQGATVFSTFINAEKLAPYVGIELAEKLSNPLLFMALDSGSKPLPTPAHGYDVTILIDVCRAILAASDAGVLTGRHQHIVKQARVILNASAKAGIKNLVYAVAGYDATREEVIAAFKFYVQEEARQYEKEFPDQLYEEWYRLYELTRPERNKPWKFRDLTIKHVYQPLAASNGKIYQLTRTTREKSEEPHKKLHQFLSEVGVKALRTHLGRLLGMAETSKTRTEYEAHVQRIFGVQLELPNVA
jgi:P63C domain